VDDMTDKLKIVKSGRLIQNCDKCGKRRPIWSNANRQYLCKDCATNNKATDAGLDAMRQG